MHPQPQSICPIDHNQTEQTKNKPIIIMYQKTFTFFTTEWRIPEVIFFTARAMWLLLHQLEYDINI